MLDNSFLYKKDFEDYYRKIPKEDIENLFRSLYGSSRLASPDGNSGDTKDINTHLDNYAHNLWLISELVRDNYLLQHEVHRLGVKNRIKKKLGRYKPPASVRTYVRPDIMESILDGSFINKNLAFVESFGKHALRLMDNLSDEGFENGVRRIQEQLPLPIIKNPPLVSIIVPTRDGLHHLQRLFENFDELTCYKNYEIIVVDNASSDGTREYLSGLKERLNLQIIHNSENKSFSESNNIGVKQANGEYLLFLNNDVLPTHGWLAQMVGTATKSQNIGAVGAKLIYPYKKDFENSYKIQHGGLGFRLEEGFIRPINLGTGENFFSRNTKKEEERAGVTAACLLVEKSKFEEIEGFDESYWYGYEDVDLCLKLHEKGYRNVINNAAVLFHYEFGTQNKFDAATISGYRRKNMQVFKNKWQAKLYPLLWKSLLGDEKIFTDKQVHFGFIVTEANDKTAAGDYFTAKELGNALLKKGNRVSYIGLNDSPKPFDIEPDIDVLVSMIDGYDIGKIENGGRLIKIAWCRNWFERWAEHDYFRNFDIVLTNSEKAQKYFQDEYLLDSYMFKIATNKERFTEQYTEEELEDYVSDICFTGNYWHVPRDISELFDADKFKDKYKIKIFGKNWDHVKQLKPFWQGFLEYKNLPKVYAAGKILIDDATSIVNGWGSVNSRVFDGAASGILVLTNGAIGSNSTFDGLIPTFNSKEELTELLAKYLNDDALRQQKINEIKEYALKHHTYEHRANRLLGIMEDELTNKTINIKLPIPRWNEAKQWGDLHFGQGLKRELEKLNFNVKLQILPEWDKPNFAFANIVLRGLSVFELPKHQLNIMWNISHPEKVPLEEYQNFDYVFVASGLHIEKLKKQGLKNVHTLYQCFDETVFNTEPSKNPDKYKTDILFVGNTRNHFRKIVQDIVAWKDLDKYDFRVYGKGWEKFIDKKYIAGEHINNDELKYYYQNTKILLNDHWDDMNESGFVSNRLFDASACGTFIISDSNPGIKEIFGPDIVAEYSDQSSLHQLLAKYLNKTSTRNTQAKKAIAVISKDHSFRSRVKQLISVVTELL